MEGSAVEGMIRYLVVRAATMVATLLVISAAVFVIIQLPPGDFLTNQLAELASQGDAASMAKAATLRAEFGLDRPGWQQYLIWVGLWPGQHGLSGLLQGNLGWSFEFNRPVVEVVADAVWMTILINVAAILFVHAAAIPIALYTATRPRTLADHAITFVAYLGLATPSFLLALVLLFYMKRWFGVSIGGLMDPAYHGQEMSMAKATSIVTHLIVPTVVIGLSATAAMVRRMRANLMDELHKQYVVTARAKGVPPIRALLKYPFRLAMNPFVADIGNLLPQLVSGSVLVSIVMNLPTVGPILVQALRSEDQYLAGFILMFVAALTVVGMALSDLALAALDPRIRMGARR